MVDLIISLFLILPVLNSIFLVFLYKKLWFLFFTIFITFIIGVLRFLFRYNFQHYKYKFLITLGVSISTVNIFLVILGYTTNFLEFKKNIQPQQTLNKHKNVVLKGRVFIAGYPLYVPAANAKIVLIDKLSNSQVDVFFTDVEGKFEYISSEKLIGGFILNIEHINCYSYTTELDLYSGVIRELDIYLRKK